MKTKNIVLTVAAIAVTLGAQGAAGLPLGYQEMESFVSSKTTVRTGYRPEVTDRVQMKLQIVSLSGNEGRGVFCARGSGGASDNGYTCYARGTGSGCFSLRLDYGNYDEKRTQTGILIGQDVTIDFNDDDYHCVIGGMNSAGNPLTGTFQLFSGSGSSVPNFSKGEVGSEILLFAMHNGDVNEPTANTYAKPLRCYYFRVYDRFGRLKMNLVPCRNLLTKETAAGKVHGFYDTVARRFIESTVGQGGTCTTENEVSARALDDLQELAYVDTPTNLWVNTKLRPEWCDRVEMKFRPLGKAGAGALFWCRNSSSAGCFSAMVDAIASAGDATTLRIDQINNQVHRTTSDVLTENQDAVLEYDGFAGSAKVAGSVLTFDKPLTKTSYAVAGPLALFTAHSAGTGLSYDTVKTAAYTRPLRVYGFRLTGTNGVVKLDLVPCRDGTDGTVGLYDRVSRKLFAPTLHQGMTNDLAMTAGPAVELSTNRLEVVVNDAGTAVDLAFDASDVARKLVLAYGNTDAAGAFHAWEHHADAIEVAAGETALHVVLPTGFGTSYRVVRAFLGAVVSSASVFAQIPVSVTVRKANGDPVAADLTFAGSAAARRLFLVWGRRDVGNVLTGWVGKAEIAGGVPAGVTSLANVEFPAEARDYLSRRGGFRFVIGEAATDRSYVQKNLFLQYDGINNLGTGRHSRKFDMWADLVSSNDLSVAETDSTYPDRKDEIADSYVTICRCARTTRQEVIEARPDVQLTMEARMRPVAYEGSSNVSYLDLRYYGYVGWDVRGQGTVSICRPDSTARATRYFRQYDLGGESLKALIDAKAFNTYSVTLGYGDGSHPDSPAYFDGVLCGHHPGVAASSKAESEWSRKLSVGFIKSVTDIESIRLYDRELTVDERLWNLAVDRERFAGGDPVTVQSSEFVKTKAGLVIFVL